MFGCGRPLSREGGGTSPDIVQPPPPVTTGDLPHQLMWISRDKTWWLAGGMSDKAEAFSGVLPCFRFVLLSLLPEIRGTLGTAGPSVRTPRATFCDFHEAASRQTRGFISQLCSRLCVLAQIALFYCAFCMRNRPQRTREKFGGGGGCSHEFCTVSRMLGRMGVVTGRGKA